ncbi:hypothetical protein O6H91_18G075100 [Diphasiastrum complanatum]|nr:hypothetical protein O6H91_18G075100 [Diphasiastrum complanatum]
MFERRQSLSQTKQRRHKLAKPKISITEKSLADIMEESVDVENDVVTEDLGGFIYFSQLPDVGQKDDISALKRDGLHIHRCRLEKEVERLRATLQQEQEINFAFETALRSKPRAISDFGHLPINAQELLADIAMLEAAISSLEEQITLLLSHLGRECSQHQILETFDGKLSFNMSPVQQLLKTLSISTL